MKTIAPVMHKTFVLFWIHSLLLAALLFAQWPALSTVAAPLPPPTQQAETTPEPTTETSLWFAVTPIPTATAPFTMGATLLASMVLPDVTAPLTDTSIGYSHHIYLPLAVQGGLFLEPRSPTPTPTLTSALSPTPTTCLSSSVVVAAPNALYTPCPPATSTPRATPTLGSPTPTASPTRTPGPTATPRITPTLGCNSPSAAIPAPGTPTPPSSPCLVVLAAERSAAIATTPTPSP